MLPEHEVMVEAHRKGWAWEPPAGMPAKVVTAWRNFYRAAFLNYGVTPAFYRQMYLAQSGRCYICRQAKGIHPDDPNAGGWRRLAVDHNHAAGNRIEAVRGLLCSGSLSANTCNRLIGLYTADQLSRAVELLTVPPAQTLLRYIAVNGEPSDKVVTGMLT
jgi:hypothetical protein